MRASINQMAEWTGFDRRTIKRKLSDLDHIDGPSRAHLFDSEAALPLLYGGGTDGERLDASQERAALDRERRRAAEMANAKAAGEVIPVGEVAAAWEQQVGVARGRLLAMPARIAPKVLRATELRAVEGIIRDQIYLVLDELSADCAAHQDDTE